MGRLLDKIFEKSVLDDAENAKIYIGKYVYLWKDGVYIGYHATK